MTMSRPSSEEKGATVNSLTWIGNLNRFGEISKPNFHLALDLPSMIEKSHVGWLILGFYFTSKNLLVKLHLLVKTAFTSKNDLV